MYIIIAEDGTIYKTDIITNSERDAVADGVLNVLRILPSGVTELAPNWLWEVVPAWDSIPPSPFPDLCSSCPECGCLGYQHQDKLGQGYRICNSCGQVWWANIDYTLKK